MLRASPQHAEYLIWELTQIFNGFYCTVNLSMKSKFEPYENINKMITEIRGD